MFITLVPAHLAWGFVNVSQNCLDVRHPEEAFEVAVVLQGLLVVPLTQSQDFGSAGPDILVIHDV